MSEYQPEWLRRVQLVCNTIVLLGWLALFTHIAFFLGR